MASDNPQGTANNRGMLRRGWAALWAILLQRCPQCQKGQMFRGPFTMNDPCPECGILFQREEGTFLGAMYASYVLGAGIIVPIYFLISWLLPSANNFLVASLATVAYLPLVPVIFRYSRVLWVHFERYACPSDVSATAYEKFRLKQIAEQQASRSRGHPANYPD